MPVIANVGTVEVHNTQVYSDTVIGDAVVNESHTVRMRAKMIQVGKK